MEFLGKLFEYFIPTSRTLPAKTVFIIVTAAIVILVNDYMGLSYHYATGRKISEMERLNAIIKDTMTDSQGKRYAMALRDEVVSHQSLYDRAISYFRNRAATGNKVGSNATVADKTIRNSPVRSNLLFILSSSGVFMAFAIITIPLVFIGGGDTSFMQNTALALITTASFIIVGFATYGLASIMPRFLKSTWLLNYLANIVIQAGILYLFVRYNSYSKKLMTNNVKNY